LRPVNDHADLALRRRQVRVERRNSLCYLHSVSPRLVVALLLLVPCWPQLQAETEAARIRQLIANYAAAVDAADVKLAAQVWDNSSEVSFIHPLGHAHGWDEVKGFLTDIMGGMFSDRKLTPRDIKVHVYGDSAWSEFYWHFTATQKKDGARVQSDGRETQIYRKAGNRWVLVHVHYSEMPKAQ
jgi:ketosteroid isomerase-like protein